VVLSYVRTIELYLMLFFSVRLLGKRQVGQMEPSEFVVTILIANLASIPMEEEGIPLHAGLVPILTVLGAELSFSWLTLRSVFLRKFLCGKPVILIENGRLVQENLRKTRISLDELSSQLRLKDVLDIKEVQYAILETNGVLSVFPYSAQTPATAEDAGISVKERYLPVTIIADGNLSRENLKRAGKEENWVRKVLQNHGAQVASTMLLTVDAGGEITFIPKEEGRK
jgi:uncharacterized membrane protein YcaP (DUF421 family)